DPARGADESVRQKLDIESKLPACGILLLLALGKKIEQAGSYACLANDAGDKLISAAVATAAAAVGEKNNSVGLMRNDPLCLQFN
ncbi:MAG: hypothetical protein NTZ94_08890, partial [Verrucomicrobia bacterium]|nr:hypothetical protein [Verrucomicrobiota bacterium]